jgi:hypothetical protein
MNIGKRPPLQIVATIAGPGTTNAGDTLIAEDGSRWTLLSEAESRYWEGATSTIPPARRIVRDGKLW